MNWPDILDHIARIAFMILLLFWIDRSGSKIVRLETESSSIRAELRRIKKHLGIEEIE